MEPNTYSPGSTYFDGMYSSSMGLGSTSSTTPLSNPAPLPYSALSSSNVVEGQNLPFDGLTPLDYSILSSNAVDDQILPFDDLAPLPYSVSSSSNAVDDQILPFDELTSLPYLDSPPLNVEGQIPPFDDLAPMPNSASSYSNITKMYPNAFQDHTSGFPNTSMTQGPLQYVDGDVAYYQTGAPVYRGDDLSAHYGENLAIHPTQNPFNLSAFYGEDSATSISQREFDLSALYGETPTISTPQDPFNLSALSGQTTAASTTPQDPFDLSALSGQTPAASTTQKPFVNPTRPGPIPSLPQTSLDNKPTGSTSSKRKRKARPEKDLLPDILSNDMEKVKRAKNTEAARKSRAKRLQREQQLEQHVRRMTEEMKRWDAVAASRSGKVQ